LKRMTNSFYGYTGFLMSRVYMLDIANAVTGLGRHHIQKTKDIVEKDTPYKVIYGDTDSLMIKLDLADVGEAFTKGEELSALINSKLGTHLKLKVEYVFKSLIILAKKRYAGWSFEKIEGGWKEDITMKGIETVRRDWCDLVGETLNKVLRIILVDQKPNDALSYMKEVIQKLQNNEVEVEKLVITKGVSKRLEDYKGIQPHVEVVRKMKQRDASNAPGVGDRIGFVITKGTQLMSERAENPEYVRQHGMKIDSKYYVESQLLPPIERVFESMGIKREELLGVGRQMHLADMIKNGIKANGH
ncbi:MAG TPA: DNA polymerase domain-containing protein, partial [Candidatus Hodarchaeales archaeon]|nr:DNA polymerase domain-containing protein [Candidatus Hodarchaeales archaeon]